MKVKKVNVGIKSIKAALGDFVNAVEDIGKGRKVKHEAGVYFTSFEAFRKAMTPKRVELLHVIKTDKPVSINQLARFVHRDIKNVSDDLKYLEQIGLIERKESNKEVAPCITYDKILFEIVV